MNRKFLIGLISLLVISGGLLVLPGTTPVHMAHSAAIAAPATSTGINTGNITNSRSETS